MGLNASQSWTRRPALRFGLRVLGVVLAILGQSVLPDYPRRAGDCRLTDLHGSFTEGGVQSRVSAER